MNRERTIYLVNRYCLRQISATELTELQLILQQEDEEQLVEIFSLLAEQEAATPYPATLEMIRPSVEKVLEIDRTVIKPLPFIRRWAWIAASILLLISAGTYWWWSKPGPAPSQTIEVADIGPATSGAVLTLADGSSLVLDSMQQGILAKQGNAEVVLENGSLRYEDNKKENAPIAWNTMTIPAGRQFRLELPDGSRVWLNAASSIRYPASFPAHERKVEVKGEAYFEVSPNSRAPFMVSAAQQTMVQVLGTSFNIRSYEDDPAVHTTLIEGSVRVSIQAADQKQSGSVILKPGQQAQSVGQKLLMTDKAPVSQVIAWKNGLFNFNNTTLKEAMPQIARWYNLEVEYEEGTKDIELYGKINRQVKLSDMLRLLEGAGVHFRMEGNRKLVVSN